MRNKVFILLLFCLCAVALYAQNINPGKSGGGTSSSSVSNIVNAAQVWTNYTESGAGIATLAFPTNAIILGDNLSYLKSFLPFTFGPFAVDSIGHGAIFARGEVTNLQSANYPVIDVHLESSATPATNHSMADPTVSVFQNSVPSIGGQQDVLYHDDSACIQANNISSAGSMFSGVSVGVQTYVQSANSSQYGTYNAVYPNFNGQTNVGVFGVVADGAGTGKTGNTAIGGFLGIYPDAGLVPYHESAALILESYAGERPLFIARTNNGSYHTTEIWPTKTTNATPLDVAGLLSAYNGVATLLHNTSTNSFITVGSSPFNFTNTASQTIVLYLDANGATTTANLNGQTIFKSLAAGDHTIILKPGAYTTIAYAIATPIMTWTEL